jgi:uncharacterized protein (TIGR02757 family)
MRQNLTLITNFTQLMDFNELKLFLDFKADQYESIAFIEHDPIQIPHQFSRKEDIEISGLMMATIAWGNRKSIIESGRKLIQIMDNSPFHFIKDYNFKTIGTSNFVHRTFNIEDLDFFFRSIQKAYENGGLEAYFSEHPNIEGIKGRLVNFRTKFFDIDYPKRSSKHVSDPLKNSACKRLNMYLRWMSRNSRKGVDFGIWKSVNSSELYLPLDVHTGNISRLLGILKRKQNDWSALEEIMITLKRMDKSDPVKYDFALFGIGAFEKF